ncbi:MAG: C4-type zinc ribbon domain-containing protein [Candidatus Cloacimonadaceae bacterium]
MILDQLKTLVEMQKLDNKIGGYRILQEELPKQLSDIIEREVQATADLLAVETERAELNKKQRDLEGDIKEFVEKEKKYSSQLADIKTNKEYKAINSEIVYVKEKISELESQQLELMDQEGEIKERIAIARKELDDAEAAKREREGELRNKIESLDEEIEKTRAQRNAIAASLPTQIIKQYGNMIRLKNNMAVATSKDGSCSACGVVLRPQIRIELQLFKRIIPCENCGRILVDSSIDDVIKANSVASEDS